MWEEEEEEEEEMLLLLRRRRRRHCDSASLQTDMQVTVARHWVLYSHNFVANEDIEEGQPIVSSYLPPLLLLLRRLVLLFPLPPFFPLILILLHRQFHIPDNGAEIPFTLQHLISLDDDDIIRILSLKFRFVVMEDKRLLLSQDRRIYEPQNRGNCWRVLHLLLDFSVERKARLEKKRFSVNIVLVLREYFGDLEK
nr:unnamed protein product [Spirometra erinaceieuropaei]